MADATAWIVHFAQGLQAAVGERELRHIIEQPMLKGIPQTPIHCQNVLLWESEMLPVLDLAAWLTGTPTQLSPQTAGIVGWQADADGPVQHGVLMFTGVPRKVVVRDEQACDLPDTAPGWQTVAVSCFRHDDNAIPILNLPYLFSNALAAT